jgi:putative transposase
MNFGRTIGITYQEVYHMNPIQARKRIIHIYQQTQNYCETARRCHTSPQLVRKWVQHYRTIRQARTARPVYPAHWAWESQEPFTLIQADVKDIYDKGTLGTERWDHLRKHRLPRYQWTFLESRTRLRLLAFSREISTLHGMAFLSLAVSWLRACGGADGDDAPDRLG